jgi:hypothetical protein
VRTGSPPPNAALRPWFQVGELVRDALPPARIPPIDPSEQRDGGSDDYVGVPARHGTGAVGQPYIEPKRECLPALTEQSLIHAHHACTCCPQPERMPWESWSPGQWEWFRRRQRVMAQREAQREARAEKAGAA